MVLRYILSSVIQRSAFSRGNYGSTDFEYEHICFIPFCISVPKKPGKTYLLI